MLFIAAQSFMARRLVGAVTWERFVLIGVLGIAGVALGGLNGAALGAVACAVLITTLGVETARHREELSRIR